MEITKSSNRNAVVDNIKAIGIVLVIMGHVSQQAVLSKWIYSFHMPLFFFISGCMFMFSRKEAFLVRKVKSILVPYFCFGFLSLVYWALLESKFRHVTMSVDVLKQQVVSLLGIPIGGGNDYLFNVALWFLPCLFVVELILVVVDKIKANRRNVWFVIIMTVLITWIYNVYVSCALPWHIDVAVSVMPIVLIGKMYAREFISFCDRKRYVVDAVLFVVLMIASVGICLWTSRLNLMTSSYPSPYYSFYFVAVIGILLVTIAAKYIKWGFVEYVGRNSLIIMCVHEPLKRIIIVVISKLCKMEVEMVRTGLWPILLVTIITLLVCLPIVYVINRYLPFMLGKKMKARS